MLYQLCMRSLSEPVVKNPGAIDDDETEYFEIGDASRIVNGTKCSPEYCGCVAVHLF